MLSPSDLAAPSPIGVQLRLGGRVVAVGASELVLADAWRQVRVSVPSSLEDGSVSLCSGVWAIARGSWDGQLFTATSLYCLPGQEPRADSEHGRLAWTGRATALRARNEALRVIREYFRGEGFIEVETPTLVPCPGLDPHVHSLGCVQRGEELDWLITSPELHLKRLVVGGMPRVFEVARCFRAEELGALHEPEFTLVEWYRAFAGYERILEDTEQLIARVAEELAGRAQLTLPGTAKTIDVSPPFERLTLREAFRRYASVDDAVRLAVDEPDRFDEVLIGEVEPGLAAEGRPIFLTHFPSTRAALARRCPHDPSVAERFELYVGDVELCNGFGELTDPVEQRQRFQAEIERRRAAAEPVYPLDERFLKALEEGLPPSSGNALGLDRLVALACGGLPIDRVQAFPAQDR